MALSLVHANQANQAAEDFYRFCAHLPQGARKTDLQKAGWMDDNLIMRVANQLLQEGRIKLVQLGPNDFLYQAIDPQTVARFKGLDATHMLVFQHIEKAEDRGAWSKTLKDQTHLQPHTIAKVTKELMRRQLIKEVRTVQNRNRKVFMLWEIEPSEAVSGGQWYHDGEFAFSWIESLRQACQDYLENNVGHAVALHDVHEYVLQNVAGRSVPSTENIAGIMRTLELEEEIFAKQHDNGEMMYTLRSKAGVGSGFNIFAGRIPSFVMGQVETPGLSVPCLACPLADECKVGGHISPDKCEYLTFWLRGTPLPGAPGANDVSKGLRTQSDVAMDW